MKPGELFREIESVCGWDLLDTEKKLIDTVARETGAGKTIEMWKDFQEKFPGHSVKKFFDLNITQKEIPFW